jgi:hypothetical protein
MITTLSPDWLAAGGSVAAAVAAIVLSYLAFRQMRASREQANANRQQVDLMVLEAERERRAREADEAQRTMDQASRDDAVRAQLAAVAGIARATREASRDAARAQLQPIVFAHAQGAWVRGPNDDLDLAEGMVTFQYHLANEGSGIALNIRSGVGIGDVDYEFGDGLQVRVLRPGETIPPIEPGTGKLLHLRTFHVAKEEHSLPVGWQTIPRTYWARFENVFGEEFETRNPSDPRQSAAFMRVTELTVGSG